MKLQLIALLFAAAALALGGCRKKDNDELAHHDHHEHHDGHNHAGCSHDHSDGHHHDDGDLHADGDVIKLSPQAAERFGLATSKAEMRPVAAVVKAGGSVAPSAEGTAVVSAPSAGILTFTPGIDLGSEVKAGSVVAKIKSGATTGGDPNLVAKVDLEAAQAEFDRVESLYADRLVTLSEYNSAKAALQRAKAAYSSSAATGLVKSPISGVISSLDAHSGQFVEAGAPIATVASAARLVVRAEVPVNSYRLAATARDARVVVPATGQSILLSTLDGRRLDFNSSAASSGGYVPVTFSVRNDGSLIPGQSVEVYLLGSEERNALTVPVTAIAEQQGSFFVYQRLDDDCYRRLPVSVGASDGANIEILSGLQGGEDIVSVGVTAVKLAQTSGTVPEGHSHSH